MVAKSVDFKNWVNLKRDETFNVNKYTANCIIHGEFCSHSLWLNVISITCFKTLSIFDYVKTQWKVVYASNVSMTVMMIVMKQPNCWAQQLLLNRQISLTLTQHTHKIGQRTVHNETHGATLMRLEDICVCVCTAPFWPLNNTAALNQSWHLTVTKWKSPCRKKWFWIGWLVNTLGLWCM